MILVSGASGVVGRPLCDRLTREGIPFASLSRSTPGSIRWDLLQAPTGGVLQQLAGFDTLVHCAPIWLLPRHLPLLKSSGTSRLIVFSSTSVLSKRDSPDPDDQRLVNQLAFAENALQSFCESNNMALTIFRPSMIYGYGLDQNIMQIVAFIKRFEFMMLVGRAPGIRQPVHADDLVEAVLAVRENTRTIGKVYHLAGAEQLSYRELVERIFVGLRKPQRIVSMPLVVVRCVLYIAAKISRFAYSPEMANRMAQDLNYDNSQAIADFGFHPQKFLKDPERDLSVQISATKP